MKKIFNTNKPIIGMLHIDDLLGNKNYKGVDHLIERAKKDISALQSGGINGILIENWKENSSGEFVSPETAVSLTYVVSKIIEDIKVPFGFNILNNDYKVALSLASMFNANFIQMDVFVDNVVSDFKNAEEAIENPFEIHPDPQKIKSYSLKIKANNTPIFAFVQPKHYKLLEDKSMETSVQQANEAGAAAILVTKETGTAPTLDRIRKAKSVSKVPVGIGSGFSIENAKDYLDIVDFAVVGTSIKENKDTDNPVSETEVRKLMDLVRNLRTIN